MRIFVGFIFRGCFRAPKIISIEILTQEYIFPWKFPRLRKKKDNIKQTLVLMFLPEDRAFIKLRKSA